VSGNWNTQGCVRKGQERKKRRPNNSCRYCIAKPRSWPSFIINLWGYTMKRLLMISAACMALATPASADLVLSGGNVHDSLTAIGGAGFGALPRLLNLQDSPSETGSNTPSGPTGEAKCNGSFFCSLPTLTAAGWTSGANVGVGVNWDQIGQSGAQLDSLDLTIYSGTTALRTFSLASGLAPVIFSPSELDREPGNGNAVFLFVLDAAQQGIFNGLLALPNSSNFVAGLGASAGCVTGVTCTWESNDGPDSFVAVHVVPAPIVGAGLPGLILAMLGMVGLARRRRRD
jgi:hypothetical protein